MAVLKTRALLMALLSLGLGAPGWATTEAPRQVLVLHSYNESLPWTSSISRGLREGLAGQAWDLWFEYLDAKNVPANFDFSVLDAPLKAKYLGITFDLVIVVDDPAYEFFSRTRSEVFHDSEALVLGVNSAPKVRLPRVSYFLENPDYRQTINLALALFPRRNLVHIVLDQSLTSHLIREQIESLAYNRPVRFDWIDKGSMAEVVARCRAIQPGEILLYGEYFDPEVGAQSDERILRRISEAARVPVFAFWSFHMAWGAVGGYLLDGLGVGAQGAQAARELLIDHRPTLYCEESWCQWTFDWAQASRYRLDLGSRVPGASWLNRPTDFWAIHKIPVVLSIIAFLVLGGFTVLIYLNLRAKQLLVEQRNGVIATQRELMASLGDVIETRSEETASHVQRITRLSVLLGRLAGLPETQTQQLEVCASMHDIGKIGIPDSILKNPGALTAEERKIMETHTLIGHSIFCNSPNPMFRAAAVIALEHHERWDGTGYPQGKVGLEINVLARVVTVVDVFDALLTERIYKAPWPLDQVRDYLKEQSGRIFDPELARILLDHWDTFVHLRISDSTGHLLGTHAQPRQRRPLFRKRRGADRPRHPATASEERT